MNSNDWTSSTVTSADGTTIAYETLGSGAGLIVVGGVLSTARNYIDLGRKLAGSFTVHLTERRGRGALFTLAALTGARLSELLALQWADVGLHDLDDARSNSAGRETATAIAALRRLTGRLGPFRFQRN